MGEGLLNDAVSVVLFNTVLNYTNKNNSISMITPFKILIEFIKNIAKSILFGLLFGFLNSYLLKNFRSLTSNPINEIITLFIFGYLSYHVSENKGDSGIISLLICSFVMA